LDYARAYREGHTTPEEVAHRALDAIEASDQHDPPLRAFIAVNPEDLLRQAKAATERIGRGRALGPFDGVPVAVKDEVDMVPYPTTVGTAFLGQAPATEDATAVARLRAAGALLLGKANMHEIGIGVTGLNPHHGTARNPYDPRCHTGGSSSGPAAAVAAGLCPVALGADGGGSIRIPASLCGVVGLKGTFGRVSEYGAAPLGWTVGHLGPLAATATDAALAYTVLAGPDPRDPHTLGQPEPNLGDWDNADLQGLVLGVYQPWFEHADPEVVAVCQELLAAFEARGARVRDVVVSCLEAGRVAHAVIIAAEMSRSLESAYESFGKEHGLDVRASLALARRFTARDYLKAQQVRTRLMACFDDALSQVHGIVTPVTAGTAPLISAAALAEGESNLTQLMEIMRFAPVANLTGLPAISIPAGYNQGGLPVGLQAIGRAWDEPTLLRLALAAEQSVARRRPQVHFDILPA
jgi:Asp-tRNA(Asn)/Glu-tRNA(Gln) amidotransferase A subunit family amidase